MTDGAWVMGFGELQLAFPNREQQATEARARSEVYRRHLDDLTDQQWAHAVAEVIRQERWFPTVAALREYAETWTPPVAGYLGQAPRTEEQDAIDRATARKGLTLIKAAVADLKLPIQPPPSIPEPVVVHASDERLDELRRQRDAILTEGK